MSDLLHQNCKIFKTTKTKMKIETRVFWPPKLKLVLSCFS